MIAYTNWRQHSAIGNWDPRSFIQPSYLSHFPTLCVALTAGRAYYLAPWPLPIKFMLLEWFTTQSIYVHAVTPSIISRKKRSHVLAPGCIGRGAWIIFLVYSVFHTRDTADHRTAVTWRGSELCLLAGLISPQVGMKWVDHCLHIIDQVQVQIVVLFLTWIRWIWWLTRLIEV